MDRSKVGLIFSLTALLYSLPSVACIGSAKTDLEKALCEIKARDENSTLPSLSEFRRNPARTQYLLLKRPAEKLGIELKEPVKEQTRVNSAPQKPAQKPVSNKTAVNAPPRNPAPAQVRCRLTGELYICGPDTYQLQHNQSNARLAAGALERTRLQLPPAKLDMDIETRNRYLFDAYHAYIKAMLQIGLADVTLSYTKFHHFYDDAQLRRDDFSQRLSEMFEFLKKDKKTMAAGRRKAGLLPQDPQMCQPLSDTLVVCDDVVNNWVYRRK